MNSSHGKLQSRYMLDFAIYRAKYFLYSGNLFILLKRFLIEISKSFQFFKL